MDAQSKTRKIWKLVLTGGPCGGKTTGQARLCTFFENLGWKVYRVPEMATILLPGGVNFAELSAEAAEKFQENLLMSMMQVENTFFDLAEACTDRNVLVICDRGTMDASAFITRDQWNNIIARSGLDEVEIRDNRYNQVIHMVTSAKGAEEFYTVDDNAARSEGLEEARMRDTKAAEAWVGHPYVDVVDNSSDFEHKINVLIEKVSGSMGLDVGDRLQSGARKLKYVVNGPLPGDHAFPSFRDFEVCHHYLNTASRTMQSRLRKRGVNGKWCYTHTIRKQVGLQTIEVKTQLTHRDYTNLLSQENPSHFPVFKTRRCFMHKNQYFQLDIYREPSHRRCKGLMLLETYTTKGNEDISACLPPFLNLGKLVTGDSAFSMFNLSLREEWANNKTFCHRLTEEADAEDKAGEHAENNKAKEAVERLEANTSRQSSPKESDNGSASNSLDLEEAKVALNMEVKTV